MFIKLSVSLFFIFFASISFSQNLGERDVDVICKTPGCDIKTHNSNSGKDSIRVRYNVNDMLTIKVSAIGYKSRRAVHLSNKKKCTVPSLQRKMSWNANWKYIDLYPLTINIDPSEISRLEYKTHYDEARNKPKNVIEAGSQNNGAISAYSEGLLELFVKYGFNDESKDIIPSPWDELIILPKLTKLTAIETDHKDGSALKIHASITWDVQDGYGNLIGVFHTSELSDPFKLLPYSKYYTGNNDENNRTYNEAVIDAFEYNALSLLWDTEFRTFLEFHIEQYGNKERVFSYVEPKRSISKELGEGLSYIVKVINKDKVATGTIISQDGYIISDFNSVSKGRDSLEVLINGDTLSAEVVGVSEIYNLSLLKINKPNLEYFGLSQEEQQIGEMLYSFCYSESDILNAYVTRGGISCYRYHHSTQLLQIDAPISDGNFGGACVDEEGRLVGILVSKINSLFVEGVAFVLPIKSVFNQLGIHYKEK